MMKKTTILLLLASMLLSACAQSGDGEQSNETAAESASGMETIAETVETEMRDNVPELDFGGDTLTFSTNNQYYYEMDVEETNGEITNDVVYNRNLMMEERFNVVIDHIVTETSSDHYAQANFIRQTVMSGDQAFDIAANYVYTAGTVVQENLLLDWHDIPYIELEQPWWVSKINDAFTLDGKLFAAVSDMCVSSMQLAYGYLFNKQLAEEYDVEDYEGGV